MVLNCKRTAFRVIIGVIIACLVGAACFLINSKETKTDAALAGFYRVSNILYQAPMYSFSYSGPENAPLYEITKNGELMEKGGVSGEADWLNLGELSETSLSASDFLALFSDHEGENATSGFDPANTTRQFQRTWRCDATLGSSTENPVNVVCFIFALKNEDMLLSYGYPGEPGHVRWLFKLEKTAATVSLSASP